MNLDWEMIAAGAIILTMLYVAFRGGKDNPVGTRKLMIDVHDMKNRVAVVEFALTKIATKDELESVRTSLTAKMKSSATSDELAGVADKVTTVCEKVIGLEKSADRTAAGVDRLERYFLELGIKGRDK